MNLRKAFDGDLAAPLAKESEIVAAQNTQVQNGWVLVRSLKTVQELAKPPAGKRTGSERLAAVFTIVACSLKSLSMVSSPRVPAGY